MIAPELHKLIQRGLVIPAMPLALTAQRELDERRQRALCRYYIAAGAGGLAVGVHTTQFQIRDPKIGLFEPVLALASEEMSHADETRAEPLIRIAGICGETEQAVAEAEVAYELGYHAGLLSLAAMGDASDKELIAHCKAVAAVLPTFGFYLQPAAGGRILSYAFWRQFVEIENVIAIKIAPFNRYQTLDVVRAVIEAGRDDVALYTGNDDTIVVDLLTPFRLDAGGKKVERRICGGLLGHWAVWTQKAADLLGLCHIAVRQGGDVPAPILRRGIEVTDSNAAFFDAANSFAGCIPGIHEVLRRQGLLAGIWCLDKKETLSPGQLQEIDRVYRAYPHLHDDSFVAQHRDDWLRG